MLLLIAIEAARQLQPAGAAARLSDVRIAAPLALAAECAIEIHTSLRRTNDGAEEAYVLEIASSADGGTQWTLHCTGRLHFPPPAPPPPPPPPIRDPSIESAATGAGELQARLEAFGQHPPAGLAHIAELCVCPDAASGRLEPPQEDGGAADGGGLGVGPAALSAILQLPSAARLAGDYPASHRITRIAVLELAPPPDAGPGTIAFASRTTVDAGAVSFATDVAILAQERLLLSLTGVHFAADRLARPPRALPPRSLFFRPELRPDLTLAAAAPATPWSRRLGETVQLVTHKFPHADICLAGVEPAVAGAVAAAVGNAPCSRRRHRSLRIIRTEEEDEDEEGGGTDGYHLLMAPRCSQALGRRVRAGGFVLAAATDGLDGFDSLHAIEVAGQSWQLLRKQPAELEPAAVAAFLISSVDDPLHALLAREFPPPDDDLSARDFKLVVYDAPSHSSPPPFPALPVLLRASRIVWISTASPGHRPQNDQRHQQDQQRNLQQQRGQYNQHHQDDQEDQQNRQDQQNQQHQYHQQQKEHHPHYHHPHHQDPFHGIASGFLRTLCSEYPHIAATHLVVQGPCPPQRVAALARLLLAQDDSCCESEIVLRDGGVAHVRRYLPDDDCSRQMGLLPPRMEPLPAAGSDWAIVAAPPADGGAVLVARRRSPQPLLGAGSAQHVRVLASVVVRQPGPAGRFGCFFAGTATAAGRPLAMVAGWSPAGAGACEAAIADAGHIVELGGASSTVPPARAVAAFAGVAIALLVVDAARIRRGDRFLLRRLPAGLARALASVIRSHGAEAVAAAAKEATEEAGDGVFCVEWAADDGGPLTLNGRPVPLTAQTITPPLLQAAGRILHQQQQEDTIDDDDGDVLPLNRFAALFERGRSPLAVLQHDRTTGPVLGLTARPPVVFSPSRVYIAVGGLGGVGRIVLPWMVSRGARHIVVLSRSPPPPPGHGTETGLFAAATAAGARIETMAVDTRSLAGLEQALARTRRRHTIAGIVHLAAVLDDAPLATMSARQWDAAVQAKVTTSWNLHLASRADRALDFFVMFSSVSGIVGTRGQANYAAGNAFQDALAVHRRSLGQPAVAIAVGMLGACSQKERASE